MLDFDYIGLDGTDGCFYWVENLITLVALLVLKKRGVKAD